MDIRALSPLILLVVSLPVRAQTTAQATPPSPPSGLKITGSMRLRVEDWNWFPTGKTDGAYSFVGALLRVGGVYQTPRTEGMFELAAPALVGLPTHATASAPQGALGQGANYRDANRGQVASLFVKQAYMRWKDIGPSHLGLRLGRFEFADGAETSATDPSLAWLKQNRIAQRLIGPFGFTHIGRSFDGLQVSRNTPGHNVTLLAAFPTRGVFSVQGQDTLTDVRLGYLATTASQSSHRVHAEQRVFGIYYGDMRSQTIKVDNRPMAIRTGDHKNIEIGTIGGNVLRVDALPSGTVDMLVWAAEQFGQWGALNHGAYALAAEIGYQPSRLPWKPWFRTGYFVATGDANPANGQHGTFMPILPTPRIYARYPFFTEANLKDVWFQTILRPNARTSIRSDVHGLWLDKGSDLWYAGGGAYENQNFGYAGRPANGQTNLGTLVDLSLDYQFDKDSTLSLYVAYAHGGKVTTNLYKGGDSTYNYFEITRRF